MIKSLSLITWGFVLSEGLSVTSAESASQSSALARAGRCKSSQACCSLHTQALTGQQRTTGQTHRLASFWLV